MPDVHVGRAAQHGRARGSVASAQAALVGALSASQPALGRAGCRPSVIAQPRTSARWPARSRFAMASAYQRRPRRGPRSSSTRGPAGRGRRRGRGGRPRATRSSARRAWAIVAATSPEHQGQAGAVDRDRAGRRAELASSHDDHPAGGSRGLGRRRRPASARRPQAAPRRRRPRRSPAATPTYPMAEHRPDAGAARRGAPRASGAAWPPGGAGACAGMASSTRSAARVEVPAGQRVADRLGALAVLLVPVARPPVQVGHLVGLLVEQAGPQHVGEQVVVAVPLAAVVERDEEQVAAVERLEHAPCRRRWPVTASHSGPLSRSRIEVSSRKLRTCSGWRCRTSSTR